MNPVASRLEWWKGFDMAGVEARAGVLTAVEVNGPMPTAEGGKMSLGEFFHPKDGATWALIWFVVACLFLFVV